MNRKEFEESSARFMITYLQEVHNSMRDTSKRIADQVQFYLTIATALLAGFFIIVNSQVNPILLLASIGLICAVLSGIGFVAFARLCTIKVQATILFARASRWSQYFLDRDQSLGKYFEGEEMLKESRLHMRHFPFTREIVFLLKAFALFNSLVFALGLALGIGATLLFAVGVAWQLNTQYMAAYGVPVGVGFIGFLTVSYRYLGSKVRRARRDFLQILGANQATEITRQNNHTPLQTKKSDAA